MVLQIQNIAVTVIYYVSQDKLSTILKKHFGENYNKHCQIFTYM